MKKKLEWEIDKARFGYYIYNHHLNKYLHKNLTLHSNCGVKNFWSTYRNALYHLNQYLNQYLHKNTSEFITKDEMTI